MTTHLGADNKFRRLVRDRRGATMVEYAILLFLILVTASAVYKNVGKKTREAGDKTTAQFM
jgi:Flp pilus assembly pilin Flp